MNIIISILLQVSNEQNVEMADKFRSDGKIYVVILVVLTVLTGLLFYLIRTDRKISKLENLMKDKSQIPNPKSQIPNPKSLILNP